MWGPRNDVPRPAPWPWLVICPLTLVENWSEVCRARGASRPPLIGRSVDRPRGSVVCCDLYFHANSPLRSWQWSRGRRKLSPLPNFSGSHPPRVIRQSFRGLGNPPFPVAPPHTPGADAVRPIAAPLRLLFEVGDPPGEGGGGSGQPPPPGDVPQTRTLKILKIPHTFFRPFFFGSPALS